MASITTFPSGPFETNALVVACKNTAKAWIIDPAPGSAAAIQAHLSEKTLTPIAIVLTHSHMDHIGDAAKLKRTLQLPLWAHVLDTPNMEKPGSDGLPLFFPVEAAKVDAYLEEGMTMELGELHFRVLHTPGHSPGGVCLYEEHAHILISGDTLFRGSIGNLAFPTANAEDMWHSLKRLAKLPPETVVYPGHGESTTIGEESWLSRAQEIFE